MDLLILILSVFAFSKYRILRSIHKKKELDVNIPKCLYLTLGNEIMGDFIIYPL